MANVTKLNGYDIKDSVARGACDSLDLRVTALEQGGGLTVVDTVQDGNMNAVTSNAVYDAVDTLNAALNEIGTEYYKDNTGTYNANGSSIYTGCSLTLEPGSYILTFCVQIGIAVGGYRQGCCITTDNSTGSYDYPYTLIRTEVNATMNQYYSVTRVAAINNTTTFYGMAMNGPVSTSMYSRLQAIKIK